MKSEKTPSATSPWRNFWEKGGWWRATIFVVVYYILYQFGGLLFVPLRAGLEPGSAGAVITDFVLPLALGGVLLIIFALSVGWGKELFARQPIRGGRWMWAAVCVVLGFNALRFISMDFSVADLSIVAAWLLAGLFVGFAEEVLTRGYVVNFMRKAGSSERVTALVSAALFSVIHAGNALGGQSIFATVIQLFYTFAFGICMYLTLRVTGNLVWPILLHATTDPSIFLLTTYPQDSPLTNIATLGNFAVIFFGFVALFFIRGRVSSSTAAHRKPSREGREERIGDS